MAGWAVVIRKSDWLIRQRFYFRVVADNGETVAQSEMFRRHHDAVDSANRLANAKMTVTDQSR